MDILDKQIAIYQEKIRTAGNPVLKRLYEVNLDLMIRLKKENSVYAASGPGETKKEGIRESY